MTPQQEQQLKEVIQEANPEIMELKFGCEIEVRYMSGFEKQRIIECVETEFTRGVITDKDNEPFDLDDYTHKILGRKITLPDVLIAISDKYTTTEKGIFVDAMGRFWDIQNNMGKNEMKIIVHWNLTKPLSQQTPETKQMLYDLLVKKLNKE